MLHRISAVALLVGMPLVTSADWTEGVIPVFNGDAVSADSLREEIPVSPRTLTILFATANYTQHQAKAFIEIIYRESRFDPTATNSDTGAYGLGQALPPEKMAEFGDDWKTNINTQLEWTMWYIGEVYGTPVQALEHHDQYGWY